MTDVPPKRKPFEKEEFDRCVRAIGRSEMEVRREIGLPSVPKSKQVRPADFTLQQARCVRMMAVYPDINALVVDARKHFPGATIEAIRPYQKRYENSEG